ncbi:MAG TPA: ATP-binding protein [Dissulfurispiraceae bacterium]|nr:ATP-binding protein [Dissulfurispiraceae bacterium]
MNTFIIAALLVAIVALIVYIIRTAISIREFGSLLKELSSGNPDARSYKMANKTLDRIARDIVSVMDLTRERRDFAEQERERLEAILRGMSDGVLMVDIHGRVVLANRAFRKLLRISEDIEKKQIMEVLRNADMLTLFNRTMDTWEIASAEITVSRSDKDLYLIATAVPIYAGDSVRGTVITLHDITRLKLLEEMRKDFVANVSHEIKTPITALKGFAETLLDGAIEDRENAMRFLSMIKNHSERLNSLVDDLLTLSRIELGDIIVNKSETNLDEVVDTVFAILKDKADKKGLYLKKAFPQSLAVIYADRDRLVQILLNLVDNGIKFSEKGGVTVGLEVSGNLPALFVEDTGIGVPSSHLPRLGERFYRVDRARSREMGGTGLGLAIVKHLAKAHNWEMTVESAASKGTRVKLIIQK